MALVPSIRRVYRPLAERIAAAAWCWTVEPQALDRKEIS